MYNNSQVKQFDSISVISDRSDTLNLGLAVYIPCRNWFLQRQMQGKPSIVNKQSFNMKYKTLYQQQELTNKN